MVKLFIVDDEPAARDILREFLEENYSHIISLCGVAGSVSEAVGLIASQKPDILLLDIDLPDGTAFDILNSIERSLQDNIIFITAHNHYAIKAIKFSALDYLLKPWDPEELKQSIDKALDTTKDNNSGGRIELLRSYLDEPDPAKRDRKTDKIALRTAGNIHIIKIDDIISVEADVNYVSFHIADSKPVMISRTLKDYEELLTDSGFFRCHQSHLVNLEHIVSYRKNDGGSLVMTDGSEIPVSLRKREKLNTILKRYFS